jgi:photosystem II stability/assembly factor-like uncharacterized protein
VRDRRRTDRGEHLAATPVDPNLLGAFKWRNVGPFAPAASPAVTGVIGQPGVFYMGLPLGGVWKTTSAGETWYPVFDDVKEASSVGSVQVAPSDPNIIYAGMGDLITGGGINEGNGVYKSTDAGKTWTHLGLDDTKQIPTILVDPKNPDVVLLAAQGNIHTRHDLARRVPQHRRRQDLGKDALRGQPHGRAGNRVGLRSSRRDARDHRAALHGPERRTRRAVLRRRRPVRARSRGWATGTSLFKSTTRERRGPKSSGTDSRR